MGELDGWIDGCIIAIMNIIIMITIIITIIIIIITIIITRLHHARCDPQLLSPTRSIRRAALRTLSQEVWIWGLPGVFVERDAEGYPRHGGYQKLVLLQVQLLWWMHGWIYGCMDDMDGWMDVTMMYVCMDGWMNDMDGWMMLWCMYVWLDYMISKCVRDDDCSVMVMIWWDHLHCSIHPSHPSIHLSLLPSIHSSIYPSISILLWIHRKMELLTQPGSPLYPTIDCFTRPGELSSLSSSLSSSSLSSLSSSSLSSLSSSSLSSSSRSYRLDRECAAGPRQCRRPDGWLPGHQTVGARWAVRTTLI